jgi:hypothetical protein
MRIRRVSEVFTQELRSSVLGGVSNQPYVSSDHAVSFVTLMGGVDPVAEHDYGKNGSFETANNFDLVWPAASGDPAAALENRPLMLVNNQGDAIIFTVTNVQLQGNGLYNVVHAGCANTIAYTPARTMTMRSRSVGFRYDPATKTLYMTEGGNPEIPVAFDLSSVKIEYVYATDSGATVVRSTPLSDGTGPVRRGTLNGQNVTLQRIGLSISATSATRGARVLRTTSGEVEMNSRHSFTLDRVRTCP